MQTKQCINQKVKIRIYILQKFTLIKNIYKNKEIHIIRFMPKTSCH